MQFATDTGVTDISICGPKINRSQNLRTKKKNIYKFSMIEIKVVTSAQ